jgi:hypothetical protein
LTGVRYPIKFLVQIILPCEFPTGHERVHRRPPLASLALVRALIIIMGQPFAKILLQFLYAGIDLFPEDNPVELTEVILSGQRCCNASEKF